MLITNFQKSAKEQSDMSRKKCISDESGYFEGAEDLLPGESGSIEILFEKYFSGNNNSKARLPVPSPASTSGAGSSPSTPVTASTLQTADVSGSEFFIHTHFSLHKVCLHEIGINCHA
jgi:hypothetical protein